MQHTSAHIDPNAAKFFEIQTRSEIATILDNKEPFRDMLRHTIGTVDNLAAATYYGTAHVRIGLHSAFLEKCHEATNESIRQDEQNAIAALQAKLNAQELENAFLREQQAKAGAAA